MPTALDSGKNVMKVFHWLNYALDGLKLKFNLPGLDLSDVH